MKQMRRPLILVADDDPDLRDLLDLLLTDAGYDVVTVADGADAVRVAIERDVDLLVLDVRMPGMGGGEALRAYHQRAGRAPVILFTASPSRLPAVGAADVIAKPFDVDRVLEAIARHLAPRHPPSR